MTKIEAANNIEVLAQKIYEEGIEKANQETEQILAEAKKEAATIIAAAEAKSRAISEEAKQNAEKIRQTTEAELHLAGKRFINELRLKISKLLVADILAKPEHGTSDPEFITSALLEIIRKWEPQAIAEISIDKSLEKRLKEEIRKVIPEFLDKIKLAPVGATNDGLTVIKTTKGYEFQFEKDAFNQFLSPYFSTLVKEIIFNKDG